MAPSERTAGRGCPINGEEIVLEIKRGLTQRERSMLARKVVGFADAEVIRAFGCEVGELERLMTRVLELSRKRL